MVPGAVLAIDADVEAVQDGPGPVDGGKHRRAEAEENESATARSCGWGLVTEWRGPSPAQGEGGSQGRNSEGGDVEQAEGARASQGMIAIETVSTVTVSDPGAPLPARQQPRTQRVSAAGEAADDHCEQEEGCRSSTAFHGDATDIRSSFKRAASTVDPLQSPLSHKGECMGLVPHPSRRAVRFVALAALMALSGFALLTISASRSGEAAFPPCERTHLLRLRRRLHTGDLVG